MYSRTLIVLTLLLCVGIIYLVYNCNCETFQDNQRELQKRIRQKTRKFMKPILRENLKNPEFRKKFQTDPKFRANFFKEMRMITIRNMRNKKNEKPPTTPSTKIPPIPTPTLETPKPTVPAPTTSVPSVPTTSVTESSQIVDIKPVKLDPKYTVNTSGVKMIKVPVMNNLEFYELKEPDSKIDISNVNVSKFTFSAIFSPVLPPDTNKKEQENAKQIIASSNSWYLQLKSNNCKFVYNGVSVESKVNITFSKYYLVSVVVAKTYISILINGNEVKKEYNVPELKSNTFKLGLSSRNSNPFYGLIGNVDIVSGNLTSTEICARHNFCSNEAPSCSFKAAGRTRMDCIKLCDNDEDCSSVECQNICLKCNNPLNCEWLSLDGNTDFRESSVPDAPEIRALAHGDGQIVLDWQAPNENGSAIKNYAIIVKESFNKSNGITFRQLADTSCTACEYIINGLKNRIYYDVSVAAVNDIGISEFSNVESVAPVGPIRNTDVSPLLIEDDAEIENQARKVVSDELNSQICQSILSQNRDGHYLNKKRVKFAKQVQDELVPKLFK